MSQRASSCTGLTNYYGSPEAETPAGMLVALLFATQILCVGYVPVRWLACAGRLTAPSVGLIAPAGLAVVYVIATWVGALGVRPPVPGVVLAALTLASIATLIADRQTWMQPVRTFVAQQPLTAGCVALAVIFPVVCLDVTAHGLVVPLSPHDGAFHVETIDAFRRGLATVSWYPPGIAAGFGSALQALPWIDSALGAAHLGLGLVALAQLTLFGLGAALLRDVRAASLGTLFSALTYLFVYYTQLWSGWPQMAGIVLVCGVWIGAQLYAHAASLRLAVLIGCLLGATVVVHGSDLYTDALVVLVIATTLWRTIRWRPVALGVLVALCVAAVCAAPYASALLAWLGAGGAYASGAVDGAILSAAAESGDAAASWGFFALDALGIDLPIRLVLLCMGIWTVVRQRRGLSAGGVLLVFVLVSLAATFLVSIPLVQAIYAVTYPWAVPYRPLTFASVPAAVIAGLGGVACARFVQRGIARINDARALRLATRAVRVSVAAWLLVALGSTVAFVRIPVQRVNSYAPDDAAAMAWLRVNVRPGEVVLNDGFADAGIWAPYKAGVPILIYRSAPDDPERSRVLENIARLDKDPAALASACRLGVRYVYYGARNSSWQTRTLPPVDDLVRAAGLRPVYASGDARVFAVDARC
ncbi:MAG: hypothetical protein NVSMB2_04690 [Chloroflexota bacterium]